MTPYRLYIVPRTDMASMTPGKTMAQVSHASNQFSFFMDNYGREEAAKHYKEWCGTKGCGTAIILAPPKNTINQHDLFMEKLPLLRKNGLISDVTVDESYSVKDGDAVHYIPGVITAMYYFATSEISRELMPEFDLDLRPWG